MVTLLLWNLDKIEFPSLSLPMTSFPVFFFLGGFSALLDLREAAELW
jgi:hypothetical protein